MAEIQQPNYELARALGFYGAGGKDPGQSNADLFNKGVQTVGNVANVYDQIINSSLAQKRAQLEMSPVGPTVQQAQGQASTRVAPNIFPQPTAELEGTASQQIGPANPFASQAQPGPAPTAPMETQRANLQAVGVPPETPMFMVGDRLKLATAPIEQGLKQAETTRNLAQAQKDLTTTTNELDRPAITRYQPSFIKQYVPDATDATLPKITIGQVNQAILAGKGDITLGNKEQQQQDALEEKARGRITSMRGDQSLARTEAQRDASIQAYNTIAQAEKEGRILTKPEYYDVLGQMWKARSGAAPTIEAIQDLDNKTFKGDLSKAFTYITGQPSGATTQDVMANVKQFAKSTGEQMDKLHEGYMQSHLDLPTRLAPERAAAVKKLSRGLSFSEATQTQSPTVPPPDATPKIEYANNGIQRIQSSDGWKTWTPVK